VASISPEAYTTVGQLSLVWRGRVKIREIMRAFGAKQPKLPVSYMYAYLQAELSGILDACGSITY
jgi:hypothetical protein